MSMPFGYVSPAQAMRDKAEYARQGIARGRSCVTLEYEGGILMMAPNPSSALHKISEIYDRIAFAAVGRYNEYETLRKAGITYADLTGYQFDRHDVTARGIANYYAQNLGTIFTENLKPFEVEIVVAEVGEQPEDDQIYRITFDGSVTDEPGFVAFGGQADQVSADAEGAVLPGHVPVRGVRRGTGRAVRQRQRRARRDDGEPAGSRHPGPGPGSPHLPPDPRRPARGAHQREPLGRAEKDAPAPDAPAAPASSARRRRPAPGLPPAPTRAAPTAAAASYGSARGPRAQSRRPAGLTAGCWRAFP